MAARKPDAASLKQWLKTQLKKVIGFNDDGQISEYVISISSAVEVRKYLEDFMGDKASSSDAQKLISGLLAKLDLPEPTAAPAPSKGLVPDPDPDSPGPRSRAQEKRDVANQMMGQRGRGLKVKFVKDTKKGRVPAGGGSKIDQSRVNPMRERCGCQASRHELFSNCTACGRVACVVEGEGPCFFCDSFVEKERTIVSEEFKQIMAEDQAGSGKPAAESAVPSDEAMQKGLEQALQRRNDLLSRSSNPRGQVFDDQADYYRLETNVWLSEEEKEKARRKAAAEEAKREANRAGRKIKLEIALGDSAAVSFKDASDVDMGWESKEDFTKVSQAQSKPAAKTVSAVGAVPTPAAGGYYANDTLSGKAKQVYESLQRLLKDGPPQPKARTTTVTVSKLKDGDTALILSAQPATRDHGEEVFKMLKLSADLDRTGERVQHGDPYRVESAAGDEDFSADLRAIVQQANSGGAIMGSGAYDESAEDTVVCRAPFPPIEPAPGSEDENEESAPSPTPAPVPAAQRTAPSTFTDATDKGVCLSMHQPWASLLVLGIKRYEGRSWASNHRGRLWIASAAKEASPEEIAAVEAEYKEVYGPDAAIPFPKEYPRSALLGCVDMDDCLSQSDFQRRRKERIAAGELIEDSASEFVFACSHPQLLALPSKITGQHKLWNLEPKLLKGVQSALRPVSEDWRLRLNTKKTKGTGKGSRSTEAKAV